MKIYGIGMLPPSRSLPDCNFVQVYGIAWWNGHVMFLGSSENGFKIYVQLIVSVFKYLAFASSTINGDEQGLF